MKRKDFLRTMRNRRRRDQLELREPERRRAADWRTLRVDLPADGEEAAAQTIQVGSVHLLPAGVRLEATETCWVRGYRVWETDDGQRRAEFQYRSVEEPGAPPPGSSAVNAGESWEPPADD